MGCLYSLSLLSVLFACSMVAAQYAEKSTTRQTTSTAPYPTHYSKRPQYQCKESTLKYDCIFHDVFIEGYNTNVYFGYPNVTENNQKNVTFKNSIMRKLQKSLLDSFEQIELLNLDDLQIEIIETNTFANRGKIRELHMSHNNIQQIPIDGFQNMNSLSVLKLDRNNISFLPEDIFTGTPNLITFSMSHNNLDRIADNTFKNSAALKNLILSNNKLTHLDLSLIPSLQLVNVNFNKLTNLFIPQNGLDLDASNNNIHTVMGPNNTKLELLQLQHNNLTNIAWLSRYSGLLEVDLSHNHLEKITSHPFKNMHQLRKLYLSNNRLVALSLSTFQNLTVLDVSNNYLLYVEKNQKVFDKLEELYLDHNSVVILKLSSNNMLKNLTLSHNDWDCKHLDQLFLNINKSVVFDSDRNCKEKYLQQQELCCKETDMPYLDRLIQHIKLTSIAEKLIRAEGRCSANDAIVSVQNMNNYVAQQGGAAMLQSNPQLLNEINQLKGEIQGIKHQQSQFEQKVKSLHTEIENMIRFYRVTKEGLVRPSENLRKVFAHLKNRRTFKEEETANRLSGARSKKQQVEEMEQNNVADQRRLNETRNNNRDMKTKIVEMERHVKRLESKKNKNAASTRVTG